MRRFLTVLPGLALALTVLGLAICWSIINGVLVDQDFLVLALSGEVSPAVLGALALHAVRPIAVLLAPGLVVGGLVHAALSWLSVGRPTPNQSS